MNGAGYIWRFQNHCALTGPCAAGLPPQLFGNQVYIHRGLDLQGGTQLRLQMSNFPSDRSRSQVQAQTIDVIQKRINALGVNEPIVTPVGDDQIEVQLAGVSASKAQSVIGQTAQLVTTTWVKDASITNGPFPGYKPKISALRADMVTGATAGLDPQSGTSWVVNVTLNSAGAAIFGTLSTNAYNACPGGSCPELHVTNWLNLDQADIDNWNQNANQLYTPFNQGGKLLTDPVIQQPITGGQFFISGSFTQSTAKDLAVLLNSGSLPVKLTVIGTAEVGATLGAAAVRTSLAAGVLGLLLVIIFMLAFYRLPGFLASLALLFYAGLSLAIFKFVPVTLTLAGLAGFVLSVGMAVDANVLIFERFKEEVRAGRTVGAAVDSAVRRAWPAIRDSNTSTLITCVLLAFFGAGEVKGFAVTLGIGVAVSLISAIVVTHNLLAIVLSFGNMRGAHLLGVERGRA